jgi:drug/metabolite transporter (DMT)-like permease
MVRQSKPRPGIGLFPIVIGCVSGLLFGAATPLSKLLLSQANSFQAAGLLYLGAALGVLPFTFKRGKKFSLTKVSFWRLAGIVLFGGALGPVFLMVALKSAAASSVAVWLNLELVATALLGVLVFRDHLDLPGWIGLACALAAGLLVSLPEGMASLVPALLTAVACLCWGMDNHLSSLIDGLSPQKVVLIKGLAAGTVNLAIGIALGGAFPALNLVFAGLAIGLVSYGASIVLYVTSAQNLGATRAQLLFSAAPFWGVLFSAAFLGESLGAYHIVALGSLAAGIVLANVLSHGHGHSHESNVHEHLHAHDEHPIHDHAGIVVPNDSRHSHEHIHEALVHEHKHYPDIHHRHKHEPI